MKSCKLKDLKKGDIFTAEMKLYGREAFKVIEHKTVKTTLCESRNTGKEIKKSPELIVIFLRHE